jgi:hypothetical protein
LTSRGSSARSFIVVVDVVVVVVYFMTSPAHIRNQAVQLINCSGQRIARRRDSDGMDYCHYINYERRHSLARGLLSSRFAGIAATSAALCLVINFCKIPGSLSLARPRDKQWSHCLWKSCFVFFNFWPLSSRKAERKIIKHRQYRRGQLFGEK